MKYVTSSNIYCLIINLCKNWYLTKGLQTSGLKDVLNIEHIECKTLRFEHTCVVLARHPPGQLVGHEIAIVSYYNKARPNNMVQLNQFVINNMIT